MSWRQAANGSFSSRGTADRAYRGRQRSTQLSRSRRVSRTAGAGHEERFPPTRLSAGCGFRKETIADLRGTTLSRANLSGAHLDGANFFKAVLDGADLAGAFLNGAQFLNCAQLAT